MRLHAGDTGRRHLRSGLPPFGRALRHVGPLYQDSAWPTEFYVTAPAVWTHFRLNGQFFSVLVATEVRSTHPGCPRGRAHISILAMVFRPLPGKTRNSSWNENIQTWRDVCRLIRLLTCAYQHPKIATEPEPHVWLETPTSVYKLLAPTTHPVDHTDVNSTVSVDIRTWAWLCTIYTIHWCADCGFLLGPLYTIYWVTSYIRLLVLSILTCSPAS